MLAVEVIAAALAAGATAGVTGTASAAVQEAYAGLKELLKHRVGGRSDAAVQALDADEAEPGVWQARIGAALTDSGAVDDERVLAAARRLLSLAVPEKAKTFNIDIGTNHGAAGEFHAPVTFNQAPLVPPAAPEA